MNLYCRGISYLTCEKNICSVNMIISFVCYRAPVTKNEVGPDLITCICILVDFTETF